MLPKSRALVGRTVASPEQVMNFLNIVNIVGRVRRGNVGRLFTWLALAALVAGFPPGPVAAVAVQAKLSSQWRDKDIRVDGTGDEWTPFVPFSKNSPFTLSLYNNQNFLYLALRTSDQATRLQLFRRGLIVWFDADGGTKKRFGIRYPVGTLTYGARPDGSRGDTSQDSDAMWAQAQTDGRLNSLEVLGPGKDDRRSLILGKIEGIAAKIWSTQGTITYRLQVPLRVSTEMPYGVGSAAGAVIGLGLATPDPEEYQSRPAVGLGGMGGGRGGGGRGRRGGFGGSRVGGGGRSGARESKPIKDWTTVRLATVALETAGRR
jgi:uncharacterized membrane protein YgcG